MKGVMFFAFNNPKTDYYTMAVKAAKRVKHFLNLPVTIVTDIQPENPEFNIINVSAETSNEKDSNPWYNKGRYRAYDLTPYDETILLDTDYLVNSNQLLKLFDIYDDFMCHDSTFFLTEGRETEYVSDRSFKTLWATVIVFKKTERVKHIFQCLEMVQNNYSHYINLYHINSPMYRNDYGITIAARIVDGHYDEKRNYIPWDLSHVNRYIKVYRTDDTPFNTEYVLVNETAKRPEYIRIKDIDFHCMSKETFMELVDE
jgi:hypothetical protein